MATKAKASKKEPEKSSDSKPHQKEAPKDPASAKIKTVDPVMPGQLQGSAWHTVEKKQLDKKKDEAEVMSKGAGGRGKGRGGGTGGRGRAFEPGRPAAMRPYSNPRPVQPEKTEGGVGGVVKVFAPVSVATTTSRTGLSFAEMLKKSAGQHEAPPAPTPAALAQMPIPQAREPVAQEREHVAPKTQESPAAARVPPTPPPSAAWIPPGVWGQKAREEAAKNAKHVQKPVEPAPVVHVAPVVEEVLQPAEEEPEIHEPEEYPAQEEEEAQPEEEVPEPEPPVEEEEEEEVVEEPVVEPPAPVAPVIPVHPRQATAYRPPAPVAPVPAADKPEAPAPVAPVAAPKRPAPRPIPQFSSETAVVLPSHLQSKADHGFTFEAPVDEEEEDEPAPAVVAAEQVVAEPLSSTQDVQTDPYMWEAHREAAVQAMLPPVVQTQLASVADSPPLQPIQIVSAPAPPLVPAAQPAVSAPTPPSPSHSLPVQPPIVPAANLMHPPASASPLSAMGAPAHSQAQTSPQPPPYYPQQHATPSHPQPTASSDEPSYTAGPSGSDMYFGGPPPPSQPQQYSPPPFPGMDPMGYQEAFGAYGAYGRKFPSMPHAHQHQQQPQQQQQQPPSANSSSSSGQDGKAPGPGRPGPPGPAPYGKPAGPPAQQTPPPMPAYGGMPPYGMPPYGMYGMYGMYGGMQGMPPQGYDTEGGYGAPGFDANKFNMAAAYYPPGYPQPQYNVPPYNAQMRPPWGGYGPGMPQGGPQDMQQKYPQSSPNSALGMGQNKSAPAPPAPNSAANKFNNPPRPRGFGNQGYQPPRYDQPQPHYTPYYPPQPGGYSAFYQHQPHPHQPGPQ